MQLDETSVCLFQGGKKGNVFIRRGTRALDGVPRWKRRCCLTHVAVACDRPEIQGRLPQMLIGNFQTFPERRMDELRALCPDNVVLVRQAVAWNNQHLLSEIIECIARVVAPFRRRFQPVLLLDASKVHCSRKFLRACRRVGVWVVLVPALLTWLLQPLDTHGFLAYKRHLRQRYQDELIARGRDLTIGEFLLCLLSAIRVVVCGTNWATAFDRNGYGAQQTRLSKRVKDSLLAGELQVPPTRPSPEELALCFPRGVTAPTELLWPQPYARPPPPRVCPRALASLASGVAAEVREGRTRGEHRAVREAALFAAGVFGHRLPRAPAMRGHSSASGTSR